MSVRLPHPARLATLAGILVLAWCGVARAVTVDQAATQLAGRPMVVQAYAVDSQQPVAISAASLAGLPVPRVPCPTPAPGVECIAESNLNGHATTPSGTGWDDTIWLAGDRYGAVRDALAPGKTPRYLRWARSHWQLVGAAFLTLEHEAMHVRLDSTDEGVVECAAIRNVWQAIRLAHLPGSLAAMVLYGAQVEHDHEAGTYRAGC